MSPARWGGRTMVLATTAMTIFRFIARSPVFVRRLWRARRRAPTPPPASAPGCVPPPPPPAPPPPSPPPQALRAARAPARPPSGIPRTIRWGRASPTSRTGPPGVSRAPRVRRASRARPSGTSRRRAVPAPRPDGSARRRGSSPHRRRGHCCRRTRRPVAEVAGEVMLSEPRAQRDLIVLDDKDGGEPLHRGEVGPLMRRGRLGGAVAHPGQGDAGLVVHLERERDAGDDRHHVAHMGDRLQHAPGPRPDVQIAPARRRVVAAEIGAQHVGDRHPQLAAGGGVADHRGHDVAPPLERMHRPHRGGLLARAEPRLGDDPRAHPALQLDVVQPGAHQAGVERELRLSRQPGHQGRARRIPLDGRPEAPHEGRIRRPGNVLRRIEGSEPLHGIAASLRPMTWPCCLTTAPPFITKSTCCSVRMSCTGSPVTATMSASLPRSSEPTSASLPSRVAAESVPAWIARMGVIPYFTINSNSRALVPCRITPASVPSAIFTPASRASLNEARMRGAIANALAAIAGGSFFARASDSAV